MSCTTLRRFTVLLATALTGIFSVAAHAQPPQPGFDPARLSRDNFYQVLEPVARREGKLVFYNFAGNFDPVWKNGLIPRFEARYGVKVEYQNVRKDTANQQLIAVHKAGQASPVDVYFAGGPDNLASLGAVVAPYPLAELLPNLQAVPAEYKRTPFGIDTQGRWPIVHRNQLVLGYDGARLPEAQVPRSFDALLAWAESHPQKLAFTSPLKGGSGEGFVYSAALYLVKDPACRKTLTDPGITQARADAWAQQAACLDPLWAYLSRLFKAAELTNGNADTLNLINNGEVLIGTAWEDHALTFVRSKLLPDSWRVTSLQPGLASGGDGLIVTANAKSPAAALLFIDMAFGRDYQAWKLDQHASRSPRTDVDAMAAPQAARYMLPAEQKTWSMPANWVVSRGLRRAGEEKVMSRL